MIIIDENEELILPIDISPLEETIGRELTIEEKKRLIASYNKNNCAINPKDVFLD